MPAPEGAMRKPASASATGGLPLRGSYSNPLTTFLGRELELSEISAQLQHHRLVTLLGPGGTGKTRLAVAVAQGLADKGEQVAFVDLAPLEEPGLLATEIATVLGLRATGESAPLERVALRIGQQRFLLILDNLERILAGVSGISELLSRCPQLRVLATSRAPLRLTMERIFEVRPLTVSEDLDEVDADASPPPAAVALFLDRAQAARPGFEATSDDLRLIGELCRRLEGLPLAIELAAARVRHLSPAALLARLDGGAGLLSGGPADAPDRHRALVDTIAWSHGLLETREAVVFGRLGSLRGSFTLRVAMGVAGDGVVTSELELLDVLGSLVDQSLLRSLTDGGSEPRFAMLDTIRGYAVEHMDDPGGTRHRHALAFLGVAELADAALDGPDQARWKHTLADDIEDLRAALRCAEERDDAGLLLRLAASLGRFWRLHGDLREGSSWLARALGNEVPELDSRRALALRRAARIADLLGDRATAASLFQESLELAEDLNDPAGMAEALAGVGMVHLENGDEEAAAGPIERGLDIARRTGDPAVIAPALHASAWLLVLNGRLEEAKSRLLENAEVARRTGMIRLAGTALANAADLFLASGQRSEAVPLFLEAISLLSDVEDTAYIGSTNLSLGLTLRQLGKPDEARLHIDRGVHQVRDSGGTEDLIFGLEVMAEWLGAAGASKEALRAWGAVEVARERRELPEQQTDQANFDPARSRDRAAVPKSARKATWDAGRSMELDDAVNEALAVLAAVGVPQQRRSAGRGYDRYALTARELEVLAQLVDGRSDPEIAEELFISPKTASVHVANIKGKLGANSRVEIVTTAIRDGLATPPTGE